MSGKLEFYGRTPAKTAFALAKGGRSPLLCGYEGTQGSPHF